MFHWMCHFNEFGTIALSNFLAYILVHICISDSELSNVIFLPGYIICEILQFCLPFFLFDHECSVMNALTEICILCQLEEVLFFFIAERGVCN